HLGFDALLISAFLAGVKRTTGLTPALSQVPNKDIRRMYHSKLRTWLYNLAHAHGCLFPAELLKSYLEVGEYVFDFAVVIFGVCSSTSLL
ncbi:hypothetical protein CVT26_010981, partial [Gymnopilus dilepis]